MREWRSPIERSEIHWRAARKGGEQAEGPSPTQEDWGGQRAAAIEHATRGEVAASTRPPPRLRKPPEQKTGRPPGLRTLFSTYQGAKRTGTTGSEAPSVTLPAQTPPETGRHRHVCLVGRTEENQVQEDWGSPPDYGNHAPARLPTLVGRCGSLGPPAPGAQTLLRYPGMKHQPALTWVRPEGKSGDQLCLRLATGYALITATRSAQISTPELHRCNSGRDEGPGPSNRRGPFSIARASQAPSSTPHQRPPGAPGESRAGAQPHRATPGLGARDPRATGPTSRSRSGGAAAGPGPLALRRLARVAPRPSAL